MRPQTTVAAVAAACILATGCRTATTPGNGGSDRQPASAATGTPAGPIDVRRFGAAGDGKTDDTAAFRRALGAAATMGGNKVIVPAGVYVISSPLRIDSNCTLEGVGGNAVIKSGHAAGTEGPGAQGLFVMLDVVGMRNIRIADLVFDANHANVHVIRMENGVGTTPLIIEGNRFVNLSRANSDHPGTLSLAISLSGGQTFTRNNHCDGSASDSFNYNSGRHLVANNIILNSQDGGIAFNNGAHGVISGNWISNCDLGIGMGHPGTEEQSLENSTTIIGNTIERCMLGINMGWFGYKGMGAPRNWTISGNVFKNNARGDINYDGPRRSFAANGAITGNTSLGSGSAKHDGFRFKQRGEGTRGCFARLANCDNVTFTGNTIVGPAASGSIISLIGARNIILSSNLIQVDDAALSFTAMQFRDVSALTVSGNRLAGAFDFFLDGQSETGARSWHIRGNVGDEYRVNAIRIAGSLSDSEIIDNRFVPHTAPGVSIACPDIRSTVVVRAIGE